MTWLNPGLLWLLGLSGVIIVVYFLRRRAPAYRVSALFLWSGREERPHSFLRLLWSRIGLLVLQLAALTMLATALANPVVYAPSEGARLLAILIDGSASMGAQLGPETRYQQAVTQALQLFAGNPAAQTIIIQAESHSRLLASLETSRAEAIAALRASQPTFEGNADPGELLELMRSQADLARIERVIFLTDHAPPPSVHDLGWEVYLIGDGQPLPNVALTQFSVRPQPSGAGFDLFVQIQNATAEPQLIPLEIKLGDHPIVRQDLRIDAGQEVTQSFPSDGPLETAGGARFSAVLTVPASDALSFDNQRFALPPHLRPLNVLWVGPANPMLEGALRALGAAAVTRRDGWPGETVSPYDLIVAYKTTLPEEARGSLLLLDASLSPIITLGEEQSAGPWQIKTSPLLAAVQPEEIVIDKIRTSRLAPQGQTLLMSGASPALYAYEAPDLRLVALPFDLDLGNSNVLLTVDFPILMINILHWLLPQLERPAQLISGEELPLQEFGPGPTQVHLPTGQSCVYGHADRSCGRVEQPGFYTVKTAVLQEEFAANPPAAESTDMAGAPMPLETPSAARPTAADHAPLRRAFPLWPFLLSAGLALLLLELYAFDPSRRPYWPKVIMRRSP